MIRVVLLIALQATMVVSTMVSQAILEITVSPGLTLDYADYTYHVDENNMQTYQLQGEYTRLCLPANAEGRLNQLNTIVCLDETDADDFFGQVVIVKPLPNLFCQISVYERASRIIKRGASAVIIDITDNEEAAREIQLFNREPLNKPVVVLQDEDADQLWRIVRRFERAMARISPPVDSMTSKNPGKVYFDLSIVLALLVLFCIICFFVIIKLKWRHRGRRPRQLSVTDMARQIVTGLKTRPYQAALTRSTSCSHSVDSIDDCPICLDNYKEKEILRVLPCGHEFHDKCVDKWLIPNRTCPMCKFNILENEAATGSTPGSPTTRNPPREQATRSLQPAPASNISPVQNNRASIARVHRPTTERTSSNHGNPRRQQPSTSRTNPSSRGANPHNSSRHSGAPWINNTRQWPPDYYLPVYGPVQRLPSGGASGARTEDMAVEPRVVALSHQRRRMHSAKKRTSSMSPPRAKVQISGNQVAKRYLGAQSSSESDYEAQRGARSVRSVVEPGYFSHCDADSEPSTESDGQCRCSLDFDASNHGTHDSGSEIPSDVSSSTANIYGAADVGHSGKDPPSDTCSVQLEPAVLKTQTLSFPKHHHPKCGSTSKDTNHSDSNISTIDMSDVSPFVSDCSGASDLEVVKSKHRTATRKYSKTCECEYCRENVPFLVPGFYSNGASPKQKPSHFHPKKYSARTNYYVHHYPHKHHKCGCSKEPSTSAKPKVRKSSLEPLQRLTDSVHPEGQGQGHLDYSRPLSKSTVSPPTRCNICQAHRSMTSPATSPSEHNYHPWRRNTVPSQGEQADGEGYKCRSAKANPRKSLVVLESQGGVSTVPLANHKQQNLGHVV